MGLKFVDKYRKMSVQLRASFWFLICSFLQKGISLITTPIFTRILSTEEYGRYNVFNSWLSIITIFVSFNFYQGVYAQGVVKFEKERNIFSSSLQGLTLVFVAVWTSIYLLFHDFFNHLLKLTTTQMLCMMLMIWASAVFNFWATEQRVEYKYKALVIVSLSISFLKPAVGVLMVLNADDKVTARILGLAIVEIVGYVPFFIIQMRKGKVFFSARFWKYAIGFNAPLILHYLSGIVLSNSDRIMIESMTGSSDAGIYSLAYSIALIMTLFNTSLAQTISPWFYQKIKANAIDDLASVAYITLTLIAVVNILLIAFAPEAVRIFAPKAYYDAIWVIPPVSMSVYFMFSYDLFAKFAFYHGKTPFIMIASIISAIVNIILNYICINQFGYIAAGYTTLFCYALYSIAHYLFMTKICKKLYGISSPYNLKIILSITSVFLVTGFVFLMTYNHYIVRYSLVAVVLLIIFIFRKRIASEAKKIISLKKAK